MTEKYLGTYNTTIGGTCYQVTVKPKANARDTLFDVTKRFIKRGVADLRQEEQTKLAGCSQKENLS